MLEKIVLAQINSYLKEQDRKEDFQLGLLSECSTETNAYWSQRKVCWERALSLHRQCLMWLVATFWSFVWKTGSACQTGLHWFRTYISGRRLYVSLGAHACGMTAATGPHGERPWSLFAWCQVPQVHRWHTVPVYVPAEPNDTAAVSSITNCLLPVSKHSSNEFL